MSKPPDRIATLKEMLWYLKYYDHSIPVVVGNEHHMLRDVEPELWAENVARWLENYQLPMRAITQAEATKLIQEIEDEGGTTQVAEVNPSDHDCDRSIDDGNGQLGFDPE